MSTPLCYYDGVASEPSEQLVIVPIQSDPLHVRYQVSCDKLQRTTTLSS